VIKLRKTELIGKEPEQHIIELVIGTSYIRNENPVSLMILGSSGSGKTELLKKFRNNKGVHARQRFSAYGILQDLINGNIPLLFEKGKKLLGHLVTFDISDLLSFKTESINSTIQLMCALTEDGLTAQSTYAISSEELKPFIGLKGGLIVGLNEQAFFNSRKRVKNYLFKGGLINRFVPWSSSESSALHQKIIESIKKQDYLPNAKFVNCLQLKTPSSRIEIEFTNKALKDELAEIAEEVSKSVSEDVRVNQDEKRLLKSMIVLAKASALREGRRKVIDKDIDAIRFLSNWMNFKMKNFSPSYRFYEE
jgi:hypothetical protein